jgi:hypothetical protein
MIRIRNSNGQVSELKQDGFVELLDANGSVAMVFVLDAKIPSVEVVQAGTPAAQRYSRLFQVPFVPVVTVKNLPNPPKLTS